MSQLLLHQVTCGLYTTWNTLWNTLSCPCSWISSKWVKAPLPQKTPREGGLPQPIPRRHLQHGQQLCCRIDRQSQNIRQFFPPPHQTFLIPFIRQIKSESRRDQRWFKPTGKLIILLDPGLDGFNGYYCEKDIDLQKWRLKTGLIPQAGCHLCVLKGGNLW